MKSIMYLMLLGASLIAIRPEGFGQTLPAPLPPMGWNSWDSYGLTITEAQFRDNVDVLADTLKPFGWEYAVIDEGWFLPDPAVLHTSASVPYEIDEKGRYIPVPARFPSAMRNGRNSGFQEIGAYVHLRGLKFGIHIVRGIPKSSVERNLPIAGSSFRAQDAADTSDACPWDPTNWGVRDNAAGQAWYDSLLTQYAAWGVDSIKVDCVSDHPYRPAEIRMIHQAIAKTGRSILLSLSPGPTSEAHAQELRQYAQMWRVSDDIWDRWKSRGDGIYDQFPLLAGWVPFTGPNSWPDGDMLPLGHLGPSPGDGQDRDTALTHSEQRVLLTLWAIARSPLILGANLTKLDPWTLALVTNRDLIDLDQFGHEQMQTSREHDLISWTSKGQGGVRYLALFNIGDRERSLQRLLSFYGLPTGMFTAKNVWANTEAVVDSVNITLPPHGCLLYKLEARSKAPQ